MAGEEGPAEKFGNLRVTSTTIAERLDRYIEDHELQLQDRLPSERDLARQLTCSRGTLRAVLDRWERAGRIWRHVGQGTYLGSKPLSSNASMSVSLDITTPDELMQSRLVIEPAVAAQAARVATPQSIRIMRQYAQQSCEAADWQAYELADNAFHKSISAATGNRVLVSLLEIVSSVRGRVSWQREHDQIFRRAHKREYATRQGRFHLQIVDAIERQDDEGAYAAMLMHLKSIAAIAADGFNPGDLSES